MGENLEQPGRSAVRTPMQWTDGRNAGFSDAPADQLVARLVEGEFGPDNVNAAKAMRDPNSLWHFIARLIQRYRACPELGWGRFEVLKQRASSVLLHSCTWQDSVMVLAHNFSPEEAAVEGGLNLDSGNPKLPKDAVLLDLLGNRNVELSEDGSFSLGLEPHGYRWFRVWHPGDNRLG